MCVCSSHAVCSVNARGHEDWIGKYHNMLGVLLQSDWPIERVDWRGRDHSCVAGSHSVNTRQHEEDNTAVGQYLGSCNSEIGP